MNLHRKIARHHTDTRLRKPSRYYVKKKFGGISMVWNRYVWFHYKIAFLLYIDTLPLDHCHLINFCLTIKIVRKQAMMIMSQFPYLNSLYQNLLLLITSMRKLVVLFWDVTITFENVNWDTLKQVNCLLAAFVVKKSGNQNLTEMITYYHNSIDTMCLKFYVWNVGLFNLRKSLVSIRNVNLTGNISPNISVQSAIYTMIRELVFTIVHIVMSVVKEKDSESISDIAWDGTCVEKIPVFLNDVNPVLFFFNLKTYHLMCVFF